MINPVKFIKELNRMCESYKDCKGCPLEIYECIINSTTSDDACKKIIDVVEQWSIEHPRKP